MPSVTSADGTVVAYDRNGHGPSLVLVDGAFCHRALGPAPKLVPLLAEHFTVYSYDRRGRGETPETRDYSVRREVEDLAAVIEAAGGEAMVFGMSSGAALAVKAAAAGLRISKLALFEPPYVASAGASSTPSPDAQDVLESLVASGHNEAAARYFLTRIFGMPSVVVRAMSLARGLWKRTAATAPSLPHEVAIMGDWHAPVEHLTAISVPTVVICGERSPDKLQAAYDAVRAANRGITGIRLPRQNHNVSVTVLAPAVTSFLTQVSASEGDVA
jgi:pimeloyl-ACP methyl ester carboxylesterase